MVQYSSTQLIPVEQLEQPLQYDRYLILRNPIQGKRRVGSQTQRQPQPRGRLTCDSCVPLMERISSDEQLNHDLICIPASVSLLHLEEEEEEEEEEED